MSNQTSPDTSPTFNRGPQSRRQPHTRSTREEWGQERKRTCLFTSCDCGLMMGCHGDDDDNMLFKVSCAAYPPFSCDDHYSSSNWAAPHCCYHYCCRLCRVITLREVMPGNMPTVCITFIGLWFTGFPLQSALRLPLEHGFVLDCCSHTVYTLWSVNI